MSIQILSAQLASQIAAGEVVERPSSVVKELVENALDAGATTINISVRNGGRDLIQVADNGSGIESAEFETAFKRHATSKLTSAEELAAIRTLGFRGEALAAIAAVSRVTAISRTVDDTAGTRLALEAGRTTTREAVGAPQGTVVAVENLFFNTPARLKFLKSKTTERRLIDELITRYALANANVRFRITHENRITFQTTGNDDIFEVLGEVYGVETARELLPVTASSEAAATESKPIKVSGFVGPPSLNWANRSHITLFVNGRWIKDTSLSYAVIQAYHTLLPTGRFPFGVIFIEMPAEEVDVNVHPAKTEVRFRQPNAIFGAVQRAVRGTLLAESPVPALSSWRGEDDFAVGWRAAGDSHTLARSESRDQGALQLDWSRRAMSADLPVPRDGAEPPAGQAAPAVPAASQELPIMRVIGQVGQAYIIAEGPDGLYLIDQHAAHERILYEKFMAEWEQEVVVSQGLITPVTVTLTPSQAGLVEENLDMLSKLGFQIEPFGPQTYQLRAVPAVVSRIDPARVLQVVVEDLEEGAEPLQGKVEARIVLRVCKSAAIKAGQTLSRAEMEAMIQQLEASQNPRTCPHGRPTMIHLSAMQLAREFGRT
ncbi:MAG: DNA mismatch repair endonuclease MutL [Candidatus Promineifilaceae bacterium]